MRILRRMGLASLAALVPLAFTSTDLSAQECSATVQPAQIIVGSTASRVSVTLSAPIGAVSSFEAGEESGLKLAAPADLPRVELAAGDPAPQPIRMANEENQVTIWLNTVDAESGEYAFTLVGADGECSGSLTVRPEG